ncbi:integrase [Burkholderia sp. Tr-20390]|nr:integrase [Burkholderia sp. Tr-20390]
MRSSGTHLVDLCTLPAALIPDTIISSSGDRVLSRYSDNLWDMSPYLPAKNVGRKRIRFDIKFADGTFLTEAKHAKLLDAAKRFLYVRWRIQAPHSRKHISAKSVINNWSELRSVLKWMADQKINSFGKLTSERCLAYAADQKGHLKSSTLVIYLQVLTTYYDLRDHLADPLPEYPWGTSAPIVLAGNALAGQSNGYLQARTEIIPARILRQLAQFALDYIERLAEPILQARDAFHQIRNSEYEKLFVSHRQRHPDGFSSTFRYEEKYLSCRVSQIASKAFNDTCIRYGFASLSHLKKELITLRTACYVVCALFSGMRASELASLEVGCFSKREGFDGELFCWLKGQTYKLQEDPVPAQWMVPDIVGMAVDVATRLGAPEREKCAKRIHIIEDILAGTDVPDATRHSLLDELDGARKHQYSLLFTTKNDRIAALGGTSIGFSLRDFSLAASATVTQADMEGVIDRDKIVVGEVWPLTTHQFRRTFAVFVARNLLGDVRYLREHFKHWSIDMTLYYARHDAGVDSTVYSEVLTERDELQAIILEKWVKTDMKLSGGGGKRITTFRGRGEVKTVKNMREFCRNLGEDVYIRGTGHSWCMASGNGCGGQGLYDAARCSPCNEGVIDDTHLQVWRGIRQQQIEVLQCPDIGAPSWQRCVDHLHEAEKVLSDLGDVVTPYQIPPSPFDGEPQP